MRCPDCRTDMALEALTCRCGWKASAAPRPAEPRQDALEVPADPAVRERAMALIRALYKKRASGSRFEQWTRNIQQKTIDWLVAQAAPDQATDKCLCRMKDESVIDENYRLIPLEKREELRASARAERQRFENEVQSTNRVTA